MPSRRLAAKETAWIEKKIEKLAAGDADYAAQLRNELAGAQSRSNHSVEVFFAVLGLAAQGKLRDTGERNQGKILWGIAAPLH